MRCSTQEEAVRLTLRTMSFSVPPQAWSKVPPEGVQTLRFASWLILRMERREVSSVFEAVFSRSNQAAGHADGQVDQQHRSLQHIVRNPQRLV